MTATQEHLMKLLLEIDDICKRHDIEYCLAYGTLLGAIRHEGFIPWDNDMDLTMTEENYDKFVNACQEELDPKRRALFDTRINREFPVVFGRYTDLESCRMSRNFFLGENLCGQCIDIFILLELPGDKEEKQKALDRYLAYDEYVNNSFVHFRMKTDAVYNLYTQWQQREKKIGREKVLQELETQIFGKHYDDCDTYLSTSGRMADPLPYDPKSAFDTTREAVFEGHTFKIPGDYVELLIRYYDDNFHLFPPEKTEHPDMSHTGIPCRAYVDDYMRLFDKKKLWGEFATFKKKGIEEGKRITELNRKYYKAAGYGIKKELRQTIRHLGIDVMEIVKHGNQEDLEKLEEVFRFYLDKQLHKVVIYWRVHFDIGDDLEYAALYLLLMVRNDLTGIMKWIRSRERNNLIITDQMLFIKNMVLNIRNARKYLIYGELEKAKTELEEAKQYIPTQKWVRILDMRLRVEMAETPEEYDACSALADEMLRLYPQEDDCRKAKGDILWKQGQHDEAEKIYSELEAESNDGLILLDIKRRKTY